MYVSLSLYKYMYVYFIISDSESEQAEKDKFLKLKGLRYSVEGRNSLNATEGSINTTTATAMAPASLPFKPTLFKPQASQLTSLTISGLSKTQYIYLYLSIYIFLSVCIYIYMI